MRKGLSSSRGAIRGTRGGAPICLIGAVGFATVAIKFGPFLCASFSITNTVLRARKLLYFRHCISRSLRTAANLRCTSRGTALSRNALSRNLPEAGARALPLHVRRKLDRAPDGGLDSASLALSKSRPLDWHPATWLGKPSAAAASRRRQRSPRTDTERCGRDSSCSTHLIANQSPVSRPPCG